MEILKTILSLLSSDGKNIENLAPLIKLFSDNSFDIKKVLQNINLSAILPILLNFLTTQKSDTVHNPISKGQGLNPISNIADKEIVYTLGRYFHQPL